MMRLCVVKFNKNVKIQVNDNIKTRKRGREDVILEFGEIESYGKLHWCGVASSQINNIKLIRENIDDLNKMSVNNLIDWFANHFPKVDLIKIDSSLMIDMIRIKDKVIGDYNVAIVSAVDLKWES